jgi:hypothetical protein
MKTTWRRVEKNTLIDPNSLVYTTVKKVKPLQAKPMQCFINWSARSNDKKVLMHFLLNTLEGMQMLKADSMVCVGICGDVWQQDRDKLHKAYTPTEVGEDGWITFVPKPEAERDACQIEFDGTGKFYLKAQWGDKQVDGSFLQTGNTGDYILRSKEDLTDVWIVAKSVFERTYEIKE